MAYATKLILICLNIPNEQSEFGTLGQGRITEAVQYTTKLVDKTTIIVAIVKSSKHEHFIRNFVLPVNSNLKLHLLQHMDMLLLFAWVKDRPVFMKSSRNPQVLVSLRFLMILIIAYELSKSSLRKTLQDLGIFVFIVSKRTL